MSGGGILTGQNKPPMNLWPEGEFTVIIASAQKRQSKIEKVQYLLVWFKESADGFPPMILYAEDYMLLAGVCGKASSEISLDAPDWMYERKLKVRCTHETLNQRWFTKVTPLQPVD